MEFIGEIYEINKENNYLDIDYKVRKAARAIVLDEFNRIAIMHVDDGDYHKLPGGGLEEGENVKKALEREILEEVGAGIEIITDVGVIMEYRNSFNQLQISYCFLGKVVGALRKTAFTKQEVEDGFKLKWVSFGKALELIEKDKPTNYVGDFIHRRDLSLLKKARQIISDNALI